jgi:hypothetical protein
VLIPVAKGYGTDKAFEVCSHSVQIYGGYGYIKEYPVEQILRDCRITMIYEGTNGIQAIDFLGRKLGLNGGKSFKDLLEEIQKTVKKSEDIKGAGDFSQKVKKAADRLEEVAVHMGKTAMSPDVVSAFAFAHPFLEAAGDVVMSWMLLWRANVALLALCDGVKKKDVAFYEGQIKSAEFFINSILPITMGKMDAIIAINPAAVEIKEESFGG